MKTIYMIADEEKSFSSVVIDLVPAYEVGLKGYYITRIRATPDMRHQGKASRLFDEVIADADAEQATLYLEISPYGEEDTLNKEQLEAWVQRKGFKYVRGMWRRRPSAAV